MKLYSTLRTRKLAITLLFCGSVFCSCSSIAEPERFKLLPAATLIVLAFDDERTLNDPAVKNYGPAFANIVADAGLSFNDIKEPMYIFTGNSGGCLFHHDNPSNLLARIKGRTDRFLGHEIREVPNTSPGSSVNAQPLWWASVGDKLAMFGGKVIVSEMISIAENKTPNLFQTRAELRQLLSAYSDSPRVLLLFQRSEDSQIAGIVGEISQLVMKTPEGQIFQTLASSRGLAFSVSPNQGGCEQNIGIQFESYSASILVSGLGSILPWGPSNRIQPQSTHSDSSNKLVQIHAMYAREQCIGVGLGFERLPVVLPPSTLDLYCGRYVYMDGKYEITIDRVQDKLHWQSAKRSGELQPITETDFATMDLQNKYTGKMSFYKDGNGAVVGFTENVSGIVVDHRKVK
jgi:hypothetical protein